MRRLGGIAVYILVTILHLQHRRQTRRAIAIARRAISITTPVLTEGLCRSLPSCLYASIAGLAARIASVTAHRLGINVLISAPRTWRSTLVLIPNSVSNW